MNKAYFLDEFKTYSETELLEIIQDRANRQPEAVRAAEEIMISKGNLDAIQDLTGKYNEPIDDTQERISKLKAARMFTYLAGYLVFAVIYYHLDNNADPLSESKFQHKRIFITFLVIMSIGIGAFYGHKIEEIRRSNKKS